MESKSFTVAAHTSKNDELDLWIDMSPVAEILKKQSLIHPIVQESVVIEPDTQPENNDDEPNATVSTSIAHQIYEP